jgi:type IV secretion system protein TrbL
MAGMARAGASAAGDSVRSAARRVWTGGSAGKAGEDASGGDDGAPEAAPRWAKDLRRGERARRGVETAAHALRSGDSGGSGPSPSLRSDEEI